MPCTRPECGFCEHRKMSAETGVEYAGICRRTYLNSGDVTSILASWGSSGNSAIISPTWVDTNACQHDRVFRRLSHVLPPAARPLLSQADRSSVWDEAVFQWTQNTRSQQRNVSMYFTPFNGATGFEATCPAIFYTIQRSDWIRSHMPGNTLVIVTAKCTATRHCRKDCMPRRRPTLWAS